MQYVLSEQNVLTLIVTFKRKDLRIIVIQISTVKTNLNNKLSASINSVRNTELILSKNDKNKKGGHLEANASERLT